MSSQLLLESTSRTLGLSQNDRVLVPNAHGDDETMAQAQTIHNLTAEGRDLLVVTVSDGEQNGNPLLRRQEVNTAYDGFNIPHQNRYFFALPDSELHQKKTILRMAQGIGAIVTRRRVSTIISPGWDGFDGHSDHRAVHIASILAAALFTEHDVSVLALDAHGEGDLVIPVDTPFKIGALAVYQGQFKGRHREIAEQHYSSLLERESYTRLDPRAHVNHALQDLLQIQQHIPQV